MLIEVEVAGVLDGGFTLEVGPLDQVLLDFLLLANLNSDALIWD